MWWASNHVNYGIVACKRVRSFPQLSCCYLLKAIGGPLSSGNWPIVDRLSLSSVKCRSRCHPFPELAMPTAISFGFIMVICGIPITQWFKLFHQFRISCLWICSKNIYKFTVPLLLMLPLTHTSRNRAATVAQRVQRRAANQGSHG